MFTCAFFSTDDGLANTTTCYVFASVLCVAGFLFQQSNAMRTNKAMRHADVFLLVFLGIGMVRLSVP